MLTVPEMSRSIYLSAVREKKCQNHTLSAWTSSHILCKWLLLKKY